MMAGIQKILKGLCDGSLVLDSKMMVRGSPSCLQRLLSTEKNFEGINFSSLIDCTESKERFDTLVSTSARSQSNDAEAAPPSCLRVSLSDGGQHVPVDVFHAVLPGLFGAEEPHHILALVEDTGRREAPLSTHGFPDWHQIPQRNPSRRWPFSLPSESAGSSSRSEGVSTARARSNEVLEVLQDLAEATFLVDPCSPDVDLVEAHLKFDRRSPTQQAPSMRMLSKINEWDEFQRLLRAYAMSMLQGGPDLPVALQAMQVRIPGAPRKLLKARHVRLSLANRSRELGQPVFLYLHMKNFNKKEARPNYVSGLQQEALREQPDDDSSEDREEQPEEGSSEDTGVASADSFVQLAFPPQGLPADVSVEGPVFHL